MTIGDYIATCVFAIGGLMSIFKHRINYIASSVFLASIIIMWSDDINHRWAFAGKLFLTVCLLIVSFYLLWTLYKQDLQEKQTVEALKSVPYYKQLGVIPEAAVPDKYVLQRLSSDSSVKLTSDKGKTGEYLVSKVLSEFVNDSFKVIHNIYIPKEDGTTAEVDILCITPVGFLIVESKNYSGWIYGSNNRENWTQTIFGNQSHFYNPIWQNRSHVKSLSAYSGISEDKMTSIVVFSDECQLKSIPENKRDSIVIQLHDLHDLITFLLKKREILLQQEQIELLYESMVDLSVPDKQTKDNHVQDSRLAKFEKLK